MRLYIIRHAEAVSLETAGVNADADRPLTDHGHAQCRALASALLKRGIKFDLILTSPYLRARQTTQGLLDQWPQPRPAVEECEDLTPDGKSGKLARLLRQFKPDSAALVGHLPSLADHAAWFIGSKKARLDLEKASVALIECEDLPDKGGGCLQWLITPAWYMESR